MANRFPIIVDSSGVPALKELASGDNLDLTGSGIANAGTVAVTNLTIGNSQGTNGQVLQSTGSGVAWADAAGGGAWNVISSQTVSSGTSSVSFTSGITGYKNYCVMMNNVAPATSNTHLWAKFAYNGNSSVETSNYWSTQHVTQTYSGALTITMTTSSPYGVKLAANHDGTVPGFGKLWFGDGSSQVRAEYANLQDGSKPMVSSTSGYNASSSLRATSINQVEIYFMSTNLASGTFTLYGLSNS